MSYNAALNLSGAAEVFQHNKSEIAPGGSYIVGYAPDPDLTLWQFLGKATVDELREVFGAAVNPANDNTPSPALVIFHANKPGSDVIDTNSKLANLHIHSFVADFGPDYQHMITAKPWVHTPNENIEEAIKKRLLCGGPDVTEMYTHLGESEKEAKRHELFIMPQFKSLSDLVENGTDEDIDTFRSGLKGILTHFLFSERAGGARVIIDERHMNTGALVVQALGDANLDRTGKGLRFFQNPNAAPS
jgi:hypothetical protein